MEHRVLSSIVSRFCQMDRRGRGRQRSRQGKQNRDVRVQATDATTCFNAPVISLNWHDLLLSLMLERWKQN